MLEDAWDFSVEHPSGITLPLVKMEHFYVAHLLLVKVPFRSGK